MKWTEDWSTSVQTFFSSRHCDICFHNLWSVINKISRILYPTWECTAEVCAADVQCDPSIFRMLWDFSGRGTRVLVFQQKTWNLSEAFTLYAQQGVSTANKKTEKHISGGVLWNMYISTCLWIWFENEKTKNIFLDGFSFFPDGLYFLQISCMIHTFKLEFGKAMRN